MARSPGTQRSSVRHTAAFRSAYVCFVRRPVFGSAQLKLSSIGVALALSAWAISGGSTRSGASVLLISIDGLQPRDLVATGESTPRIPELRRLVAEGAHAEGVRGVVPSLTFPAHTTLVTGVDPARHGITHNKPFDPLGRNADGWFFYAEDIQVPTLWDAARIAGLTTASVEWPVSVGADITWNIAQYGRPDDRRRADHAKVIRALSSRGVVVEAEHALGGTYPSGALGSIEEDERRAAFSAYLLEKKHPRLHLAYFSALDEARHRGGPDGRAVRDVLEKLDVLVGRLRRAAERSGPTVVAVVSDHGFTTTRRELDLNEALRAQGLLQLDANGGIRGFRAIAWGLGGSAAVVLRDPHDEQARRQVRSLLSDLAAGKDAPVESFSEASDVRGGSPAPVFRVFLALDTRMVDARSGFWTRACEPIGDHGHDPRHPEMDAAFVIAGPGVPRGATLGRVEMRDVAPTLASLLGLEMLTADGRNLLDQRSILARASHR